jgi:hypothetical protein
MATGFYSSANTLSHNLLELIAQRRKFVLFRELALNDYLNPTTQELDFFLSSEQVRIPSNQ